MIDNDIVDDTADPEIVFKPSPLKLDDDEDENSNDAEEMQGVSSSPAPQSPSSPSYHPADSPISCNNSSLVTYRSRIPIPITGSFGKNFHVGIF